MRFAIVRATFNEEVTAKLLAGAVRGFADAQVAARRVETHEVPGAFELPIAALWLAKTGRYDAIVCLGCVIRGETPHFDFVAGQAARAIADVALQTGVPVIFGVLTTDTVEQAHARASTHGGRREHTKRSQVGNKGYEAANTALVMARLRRTIKQR